MVAGKVSEVSESESVSEIELARFSVALRMFLTKNSGECDGKLARKIADML